LLELIPEHGLLARRAADGEALAREKRARMAKRIDAAFDELEAVDARIGVGKAEKSDLKVIFSSGYSSDFATETAPLDERFSFLEKPCKPDVLVRAVRDCLDS